MRRIDGSHRQRRPVVGAITCAMLGALLLCGAPPLWAQDDASAPPGANDAKPAERARDAAVARMIRSTVQVRCLTTGRETVPMGSGVVIAEPQTVITNHHVLAACDAAGPGAQVEVQAHDGSAAAATVIRSYEGADVAVLQVAGRLPVEVAPLRSDGTARVMETVIAVGYPEVARFAGVSERQGRATIGVVSRVAAQDLARAEPRWVLEHGAPIFGGNSGGPLFDECGAVLGINTFVPVDRGTRQAVPTVAYAVGARTVQRIAGEVTGASIPFAATSCSAPLGTDARTGLVAENVRATPSPQLAAFYASTLRRVERWQRDFAVKGAARDSAVGDAIALVGEQAARAQTTGDALAQRIEALEADWASREQRWAAEQRRQRLGLLAVALLGALATALGARALWRAARAGREVHAVRGELQLVDDRAQEAGRRADAALAEAKRAMEAAERAAQRHADPRLRSELHRIWGALDARSSHSILMMSPAERTRRVTGEDDASRADDVLLTVEDEDGTRTVVVRPGTTAYLGRDEHALQLAARRYLVPHQLIPVREAITPPTVSRCHCSIANQNGRCEVVDLSSNGTWLEGSGERLGFGEARTLASGGALRLATSDSRIRIVVGAPAAATARLN